MAAQPSLLVLLEQQKKQERATQRELDEVLVLDPVLVLALLTDEGALVHGILFLVCNMSSAPNHQEAPAQDPLDAPDLEADPKAEKEEEEKAKNTLLHLLPTV